MCDEKNESLKCLLSTHRTFFFNALVAFVCCLGKAIIYDQVKTLNANCKHILEVINQKQSDILLMNSWLMNSYREGKYS